MSKVTNWPAQFEEMIDLVELSEADRQLIKNSAPLIMKHARGLTTRVYDRLLQYPQARQFFVTDHDEPDEKRIEANRQTMLSWLRASVSAPLNEGFVRYLVAISQMHVNIPIHRPTLGPVAPHYVIGTISYYQTAIAELLHQDMADAALASQTSVAWNKWLMVGLELLLAEHLSNNQAS